MLCSPWSFELSSICYGYTLSKKKKKNLLRLHSIYGGYFLCNIHVLCFTYDCTIWMFNDSVDCTQDFRYLGEGR